MNAQVTSRRCPLGASSILAVVFALACSNSAVEPANVADSGTNDATPAAGAADDDSLFVPADLPSAPRDGDRATGLTVTAFSLIAGGKGLEFYAAVRNDGDTPSCEPGMMTDFYDKAGQLVVTLGSVLWTAQYYRVDASTIIPCVAPGERALSAAVDLPDSLTLEQLGALKFAFPAFTVDGITPVSGLALRDVGPLLQTEGTAYRGELENDFDVRVSAPKVAIFPLNRAGRPLGVATADAVLSLAPGEAWSFETSTAVAGANYVAFAAGSFQ